MSNKCAICARVLIVPCWKTCQTCDFKKRGSPHLAKLHKEERDKRDLEMLNLYLKGRTLSEISKIHQLSVSQIRTRLIHFKEYHDDLINHRRHNPNVYKDKVLSI